ncbi:MAG: hypothetical protein IPJ19_11065 [Planctomycetes bacterium]|nr:hypothetical protein [Planctomycetota bacterium]
MLALLLLCLGSPRVLEPTRADWSALDPKVFPSAWMLPEALWKPAEREKALPLGLADLLEERFDAPQRQPWMASLGDLIAEHRRRGGTPRALEEELNELRAARPATHARVAKLLRKLLVADALLDPRWDPDKERADDGVYFGPILERRVSTDPPWNADHGAQTLHQAATFMRADLDSILGTLHDYAAGIGDLGTNYERLEPLPETILFGEDETHGPFAALRLSIRSDLPFPFTHYDCDLRVLHRLDSRKRLVTYVFSPSRDFYWLAGEDVCLPVRSSDGKWQGTLLVRLSGFDLRGVPDSDDERKSGTRAALGNLHRRAQEDFARSGGVARTIEGAIPCFRVLAPPQAQR